jgi:hypothetical protein
MNGIVGAICACYSLLIVVYPQAFRDRYGREMVDALRRQLLDGMKEAGADSPPSVRPCARQIVLAW